MASTVEQAKRLATRAHEGQTDKSGAPYIGHPSRVAARVAKALGADHDAVAVAWLHDVVEDTPVTASQINTQFGPVIAAAVQAITHPKGEARADYYARVKANALALAVKAADIADNTDPARVALLDAPTRERLAKKYSEARAALGV
ncbi:MAG: HD domain-containing protein [Arthrobacter sp.]|jgi:(p)ppGpp synthase/HD superfamily hydrolase|nr:HD domain-containing protein [Arthrobacter sp.]